VSRAQATGSSTVTVQVPPPCAFKSVSGAAGAVEGIELREFLADELEVEDPAVLGDPVPVG
jgi:hypothetical protein